MQETSVDVLRAAARQRVDETWGENVYGAVGDGTRNLNRAVVGVAQYVVGAAASRAPR